MVGRDGEGSQTETAPSIAVMEGAVARCLRALLGRASHARKLPTDNAVESSAKEEEAGAVHVRIPGTLTHAQHHSKTTYRPFAVDVWAAGDPLRIQKFTQTTCLGASTACQ